MYELPKASNYINSRDLLDNSKMPQPPKKEGTFQSPAQVTQIYLDLAASIIDKNPSISEEDKEWYADYLTVMVQKTNKNREDLDEIQKTINGEDDPGYCWYIETIQDLLDEIRGTNAPTNI